MKKSLIIIVAITGIVLLTALTSGTISAQENQKTVVDQKPIPADVIKITDKSCSACHKEPGMKMALSLLNFSAWDKYTAEKQAAKAKAVCNEVTKSKMPPKSYRNNNPGAVPTSDDIKTLCDWATSLQPAEK
jgi:cytochrome c5